MKNKKIYISLFISISLLTFVFFLPNIFYSLSHNKLQTLNELLVDLDKTSLPFDKLKKVNPIDIVERYSTLIDSVKELRNEGKYSEEKNEIEENFYASVKTYVDSVSEFPEIKESVTYNIDKLKNLDFNIKKNPETYLLPLKTQVKASIIQYNLTAERPLRFELDISKELASMSLEEKIGQLFGFTYQTTYLLPEEEAFIQNNYIGTVALFSNNINNEEQLIDLTTSIQLLNPTIPIFIATDQEGGTVKRIEWDTVGGANEIAATTSEEQCNLWKQRSELLRKDGINWNLGIVADVTDNINSFIYPRVMSGNYSIAAEAVATAANCTKNVISTLKHWPGHGSTTVDTHTQLGKLSVLSEAVWLKNDGLPFIGGIAAGADTIMVGHLLMNWLDSEFPASLSKTSINYLRNIQGFKGLIVTDDMMMLTNAGYSIEDAVTKALSAGQDIIFVVNFDLATQQRLIDITKELVNNAQISMEDINSRVFRILNAKNKIIRTEDRYVPANLIY